MGEVNARLQHAVEYNEVVNNVSIQRPSELSVPKKGEIVFNRDITNFKVGDGTTAYGQLNNFIKSIVAASGSDIADVGTPSVTASTSGDTTTFTFHQLKGATGNTGNPGPQGTGINHIRKTSGSGAAGTTDTYTIYSSVEESASTILGTFNVYNGSDGNGISVKASAADCTEVGDAYIDRDSTSQTYGHIMILTSTNPREFTDGGNVQGPQGPQGTQGIQGETGPQGPQGTPGSDGITPHIDSTTGNWFIDSTDTGVHAEGPQGPQGIQGIQGNTGVGIASITKTATSGLVDTYTVTYTDSTTTTYTVTNGADGQDGQNGQNGQDGADGVTPHIDATTGNWFIGSTDTGTHAQGPQGIQGIQGETGATGSQGPAGQNGQDGQDGADGITPHIDSSTNHWILGSTDTGVNATGPQGTQGVQGEQGVGIGSIVPPSTPGQTTDVYTIMSDEQTPSQLGTFTVYNGEDGEAGADGSTWYQGTAVNAATSSIPTGMKVGDYYLNTSTLDVWKCVSTTASAKWSLVCNIRGSKWFTGSGVPSTVVDSKIRDYYLNSSDGGVWEKTGETAWTYRTNIMGANGADGATWHSGTAVTSITSNVPSGVVVGDYYLNTNTYNVYKCISTTDSTKWSLECNIKGSQGNPGSNGNSVFISYSANADGNPNHPTFTTGDKYIGIYVGQSAPSSYTGYSWAKFIGDDGQNGVSVNHISWTSNSGGQPQGTQSTDDTYTAYSSSTESQATSLGTFVIHNGADGSSSAQNYYDCTSMTTVQFLYKFFDSALIANINQYKGIIIPANIVKSDIAFVDNYLNFNVDYTWFMNLHEGSSFEIILTLTPRTSNQVAGISFISNMEAPDSMWNYISSGYSRYYRKQFSEKLSVSDGSTHLIGGICKVAKLKTGLFCIT